MRTLNVILSALFAFLCIRATAQKQVWAGSTKEKHTIPFHLTAYNNIVIKSVLNNRDTVLLMLHTASGDVTVTEAAFKKMKTVQLEGTADSVKSWGGNTNASDFSKNNVLKIEDLNWSEITIWKDQNSG